MQTLVDLLGGHPVIGGLAAVAAGLSFLATEYLRLARSSRWSGYSPHVRRVAVAAVALSVVLMGSRFLAVMSAVR